MPIDTKKAGADAASDQQVADAFRTLIDNDPDIQAVIQRVWGSASRDQRPSDTPKHLEQANHQASQEIAAILKQKGIDLPDRTFINPRSGALEGHRGWSGLSGLQKAAIIAGAAAVTGGAAMAAGGAGAAAGATSLAAGPGFTAGVPAGMAGVGATTAGLGGAATAAGLGGAASTGGGLLGAARGFLGKADNLKQIGAIVGGMGAAAGANRGEEALFNQRRDQLNLQAADQFEGAQQSRARLLLEQQEMQRKAETDSFRNALKSALAMNMKDASFTRPAGVPNLSFGGGARPSAIGDQGRQAAELMNNLALRRLMEPERVEPMEPLEKVQTSDQPKAGFWEKLAGPVSLGMTAIGEAKSPKKPAVRK